MDHSCVLVSHLFEVVAGPVRCAEQGGEAAAFLLQSSPVSQLLFPLHLVSLHTCRLVRDFSGQASKMEVDLSSTRSRP